MGARREKRGLKMQYADLGDLMVMLDVQLGGGVQEVFRLAQDLIEIPGERPSQASLNERPGGWLTLSTGA
jgi:hypothetical protein